MLIFFNWNVQKESFLCPCSIWNRFRDKMLSWLQTFSIERMSLFSFCVRQTLNIQTKSHHFSFLSKTLTERDSFRYHCMFRASLWQLQSGFFTDVKSLNGLFAIQHSRKLVSFCTLWSWKMFKAPIACLSDKKFRKPSNISLEYLSQIKEIKFRIFS